MQIREIMSHPARTMSRITNGQGHIRADGGGTVGVEIVEDLSAFDDVIVRVGGGGLIAGIALAVRAQRPGARIIGVQAEAAPAVVTSLAAGRPVSVSPAATIADGIAVERRGDLPFTIIRDYVDQVVTVGEADIGHAPETEPLEISPAMRGHNHKVHQIRRGGDRMRRAIEYHVGNDRQLR